MEDDYEWINHALMRDIQYFKNNKSLLGLQDEYGMTPLMYWALGGSQGKKDYTGPLCEDSETLAMGKMVDGKIKGLKNIMGHTALDISAIANNVSAYEEGRYAYDPFGGIKRAGRLAGELASMAVDLISSATEIPMYSSPSAKLDAYESTRQAYYEFLLQLPSTV